MFTGLVDHCGDVISVEAASDGMAVGIRTRFTDLTMGESLSVDGVCLTIVNIIDDHCYFYLSQETLHRTIAQQYIVGVWVNLERALLVSDRLSGHVVSGHIDQIAEVVCLTRIAACIKMDFCLSIATHFFIEKGSVTINGVSLTVNEYTSTTFSVMLIPHTLQQTHLSYLQVGHFVNVEFDLFTKTIVTTTREMLAYEHSIF